MLNKASENGIMKLCNRYSTVPCFVRQSFILAIILCLLFVPISTSLAASRVKMVSHEGPKKYYLALGDSASLGFQPDFNLDNGYADDFFSDLKSHGAENIANLGCYGESSFTFIHFGCPVPFLRKYPYIGPQLTAALDYMNQHRGQVSPVTLDIGVNDLVFDFNRITCAISSHFQADLQELDINLTQVILPQLHAALTVNGQMTGDLVVMNYYDPFQNQCPNTVSYFQTLNQHLANDVAGFGTIADVFGAFGSTKNPNNNICVYTWMCSIFQDYHPTDEGYKVIAGAFENAVGY